jgi:hypothetical protein
MVTKRNVVGKGVDVLFSASQGDGSRLQTLEPGTPILEKADSGVQTSDSEEKNAEAREQTLDPREKSPDPVVLDQAIVEAKEYPKVSIWSPLVMAVLRYRQLTTVRYKMSAEASELLEKSIENKYPELCKEIREKMRRRG